MMRVSDRLIHASRANATDAVEGLRQIAPAAATEDVRLFADALFAGCREMGLDFSIVFSHAGNECDLFRDRNWLDKRNAFGIGITGPGVTGVVFPSPQACARFAVAEYLL